MQIENWEDLNFDKIERDVFRLQLRIFRASKEGKRSQVHQLQKLLISSFTAKCLAVAKVSERNAGRNTAGVDGVRSLSERQKLKLANDLSLQQNPPPVRRVFIPKPGTTEKRPLGIPTLYARAQQALIALALEPEWEAMFEQGSYGFRRGRSPHDVIVNIRSAIQFLPQWVLDADIEKFFDRVDHEALLKKIDTFPEMRAAIRRILKAGILEGTTLTHPEEGTPQGGPLSPLLANIALHGMETALASASAGWKSSNGRLKAPRLYRYADDFIILHPDIEVIVKSQEFLANWLRGIGLNLHPGKTRIVHTLEREAGKPGFDFLGHTIRQFRVGRHAVKPSLKRIYTHIGPSRASQQRVYDKAADIIDKLLSGPPPRNDDRVRILIWRLNPLIRGWSNYFRTGNAKRAFSRLDHLLWWKTWKRLRTRYKRRGREWIVNNHLRDENGKWILRDHDPRTGEEVTIERFADKPILRHYPVRNDKSFFDGDWPYWSTRRGAYPGVPAKVSRLLKKQAGKCRHCGNKVERHQMVDLTPAVASTAPSRLTLVLVHRECVPEFRNVAPHVPQAASSPVR